MSSETAADKIGSITGSALFLRVVITLIVLNAIIVGLDTYPQIHAAYGKSLNLADRIILYVFSLELVLRFLGSNPPIAFFRSGWNLFDLIIVGVSFSAFIGIFHRCAPVSHSSRPAHRQRVA